MPEYACRMVGEDGRVVSRQILASSAEECRKAFEEEGFLVLSVGRDWTRISTVSVRFGRKIKDKDLILFNQELIALLKAGYPILRSLEVIASRAKNIHLKEMLLKVAGDVESGKAISEAFVPYEKLFSKVYTASLMAGERSGNLPGSIARYVQYAKVIAQMRSRIRSAMAYPTVLFLFSFIVMNILVYFILPRFADFYTSFEEQMPAITRLLMETALGLSPLFSRTLGLLLEAGISLLNAVGIAIQAVPNAHLVGKLSGLPDSIKNGESLSESLAKAGVFPPLAQDMIRIGETSANLSGMLGDVSDFYDERIRGRIDTLVSLIEPVIIILMGLVIAAMLLSVYLPIFNVVRTTRF